MKSKDDSMIWIPLWVDKWIFGSTRIELQPDERAVWVDMMALASKDNGFIRANPSTGYPIAQLSGLLCIPEELLERTIQRCLETGKIKIAENVDNSSNCGNLARVFYLINWAEYQLSPRHKRRFEKNIESMSLLEDTMSLKSDTIVEDRRGKDIEERTSFLNVDKSKPQPLKVKCNLCGEPYAIKEDHKCK